MTTAAQNVVLNARESEHAAIHLFTFEHPDLADPIRLCDVPHTRLTDDPRTYGVVSSGLTYTYLPLTAALPDEKADGNSKATISIDNIHRNITEVLRSIEGNATLSISVVSTADLDDPIRVIAPIRVSSASITAAAATLNIEGDPLTAEPFPARRFTADEFPALHA